MKRISTTYSLVLVASLTLSNLTLAVAQEMSQTINDIYQGMNLQNEQFKETLQDEVHQRLKVLTYNLGLWDYDFGDNLTREERLDQFEAIFAFHVEWEDPDILFLQEVGEDIDFSNYFPRYASLASTSIQGQYGLQILVKRSLRPNADPFTSMGLTPFSDAPYPVANGLELNRGVLSGVVELQNGLTFFVATTQLSDGINHRRIRDKQATETIAIVNQRALGTSYSLVAGDFGSSPDFENANPQEIEMWNENRSTYLAFYEAHELPFFVDAYRAKYPDPTVKPGYTKDRRYNPVLYHHPIGKYQPEQRPDLIWFGSAQPDMGAYVYKSWHTLAKPVVAYGLLVAFESLPEPQEEILGKYLIDGWETVPPTPYRAPFFMSDRFGVMAELVFQIPDKQEEQSTP